MKQHRLTSERTKTPADNEPNTLDNTAIRELFSTVSACQTALGQIGHRARDASLVAQF